MTTSPALNVWERAARAFELRAPDPRSARIAA
jgi:hypothetical protein